MAGSRVHDQVRAPNALCSAPFLVALLLLVVNDHWLKGASVAPAWLTGKLSDVAGLVVAPVVAAALCRGPLAPLRLVAAAATVLGFVAVQLSPAFARSVESALGAVGLAWRLWPDPSDLCALAVLPVTWSLIARPDGATARTGASRAALFAALCACAATSAPDDYVLAPFVVNHSGGPIELTLEWARAPVDCDVPIDELEGAIVPGAAHTLALEPSQVAPLWPPPEPGMDPPVGQCPRASPFDDAGMRIESCVAVRVAGAGLPPHLVRGPHTLTDAEHTRCAPSIPIYEDPGPGALVVGHGSGDGLRLIAHSQLDVMRLP